MNHSETHKAGFVSIIGRPNAGKSTLMNCLVGERLSIITPKAQTTRHRVMGIINDPEFQIVYSDTPGVIEPKYELQKSMMRFVDFSLEDADMILWVLDVKDPEDHALVLQRLNNVEVPVLLVLNKIDLSTQEEIDALVEKWKAEFPKADSILAVSALKNFNSDMVLKWVLSHLPQHPPFYDKDELTDKPERFFASEIFREKIFKNYSKEIPYSSEVLIESFKDQKDLLRIQAVIIVERDSQKGIVIGQGGEALKRTATQARKSMEEFFGKKVFLETFVKVEPDWRSKEFYLRQFGYKLD
ncbi:GTPase Era [Cytophaga hutchinsonii]|jgi:GTP-binding protein Era|uniref:GTPase Era n=1 Tax=Cytophaga hutchinsonii (strain ATCC 33406 / DSM 1761 / CIP 103989 / NBRC 15051 / NCIMB 9469 / D465) TaxID=269798 RepID=A0A6N4SV13_CYTH3|nr:GTPase Era [Cytophaga hutchinsonii]ABG60314.1 GTP-binding protein [Cytophaga hutchinsonii ATCC 33406]SFX99061.1 GTP-binding protein Era [Cytophaga hutchinsonii ATCC 33406]